VTTQQESRPRPRAIQESLTESFVQVGAQETVVIASNNGDMAALSSTTCSPVGPQYVSVEDISPRPTIQPSLNTGCRKNRPEKAKVLTSTPVKLELQEKLAKKKMPKKKPAPAQDVEPDDEPCQKTRQTVAVKRGGCKRKLLASSEGIANDKASASVKRCGRRPSSAAESHVTDEAQDISYNCIYCDDLFVDPPSEPWVQCSACLKWCHEACVVNMKPPFPANFACAKCASKRRRKL
jgi:hypothetical protein